jgi:hypothetical protein
MVFQVDAKSTVNSSAGGSLSLRDRKKPFTFKFQRISAGSVKNGNEILLMAYINTISDSSSPEWDERLDIGRADAKILYKSFSRTISLSFTVAVESEVNPLYNMTEDPLDFRLSLKSNNRTRDAFEKSRILTDPPTSNLTNIRGEQGVSIGGSIQRASGTEYATRDVSINLNDASKTSTLSTRVANITYPNITSGISIDSVTAKLNELSKLALPVYNGPFVGSYVKFSIGKLYTEEMGYIKGLTFDWDNSQIVWDEDKELPMITNVSMEIGYIGKRKPQVASNFFG